VPVEVARLAAQAAPEEGDAAQGAARPVARPPEIDPAQDDEEKAEVGDAGHGLSERAPRSFATDVSMPVGDDAEEPSSSGRTLAEHLAGVGVEEERTLAAVRDFHRRVGTGAPGDGGGRARRCGACAVDERGDVEPRRDQRRWRAVESSGVGPAGELLLVGEQHAGDGHDQHDDADRDAGAEMQPEDQCA
jgi:hypothetical protein